MNILYTVFVGLTSCLQSVHENVALVIDPSKK